MKGYPFISIVIPAKNEEALIGECLKSLRQLNYPKPKIEIIISDGLSTDDTVKISKGYGVKIVKNESQTVGPGRNIGFQHSKGELVAFSDADCIMDKNWLNNVIKYFDDENIAGVGGPNLVPANETSFGKAVRFLFLFGCLLSGSVYVSDLKKFKFVKSIAGSNAIYKKEALKKVMPADEGLLTCDDTEINYRLIKEGYGLLYVPDVVVWHYRRDNPKKFWRQVSRYAIGRVQLARRHRDAINLIHILSGFAIPIFIFSFIINFAYPIFLSSIILVTIMIFAGFALVKEKSIKLALNVFLATTIFITAWSFGFMRELLFPLKDAAGE